MFWEIVIERHLPFILDGLIRALVVFAAQLGVVYILGRMLEIFNSDRSRNAIAIIVGFPVSYWLVLIYDMDKLVHPMELWWRTVIFALIACIFFVLIGWHLFERTDKFLDSHFAPDEEDTQTRRKRKSRNSNK